MATAYGYIKQSELEDYTATTYSSVDSSYTNNVIESWISQSERLINTYLGQTFTGIIPDGVVYVCLELSHRIAHNRMIFDGFIDRDNIPKYKEPLLDSDLIKILNKYQAKNIVPIKLHRLYNNDPTVYF